MKSYFLAAVGVERFVPLASIPGVQLYSLQKYPAKKSSMMRELMP